MKSRGHYLNLGFECFDPQEEEDAGSLISLVQDGYSWDGAHHKNWFFEQIAAKLGIHLPIQDEKGIAP